MTGWTRRRVLRAALPMLAGAVGGCAGRVSPRSPAAPWPVIAPETVGGDWVIDIAHHDPVADFATVAASGVRGVIHKATEGYGWSDPLYAERRRQCEAAGLLWGAYHFGTFQYSGTEQAMAFLDVVKPGPETLLALDVELNEANPANSMDLRRAEDFARAVQSVTGRLPLLYIHPAWADGEAVGGRRRTLGGAITGDSILAACDLWLADYRAYPELPRAWNGRGWRFWQYAGGSGNPDHGGLFRDRARMVPGIGWCDRNVFAGTLDGLDLYWRKTAGRTIIS